MHPNIRRKLIVALRQARHREIGGILMGEHCGGNQFRISDLTITWRGGVAIFIRTLPDAIGSLQGFFRTTNQDYTRYNYLGEWHSHPMFEPVPSPKDQKTMYDIIDDPAVGANFVVLMIVRLATSNQLEGSVTVYQPGGSEYRGQIIWESSDD